MKRLGVVLVATLLSGQAHAWEADTTHAGLTEQAALASRLHATLQASGLDLGLYAPLSISRTEAPALHDKLGRLPPSSGLSPDGQGNLTALGWLLAGSVLEDIPASRGRNHFYDVAHGRGLSPEPRVQSWLDRLFGLGKPVPKRGMAAPDWLAARENDLGLERLFTELEQSATGQTPAERQRHLAFALVTAGAIVHVLEDVGSPSRAHADFRAHQDVLGAGGTDRGSRFERLAALAYGRLGVPAPREVVRRASWREYFTTSDGQGLADRTARLWYSEGTLPRAVPIDRPVLPGVTADRLAKTLGPGRPNLGREPDLVAAGVLPGATLRDPAGTCVASYGRQRDEITWSIDDDCAVDQQAVQLETTASYAAGLLDWLLRGALVLSPEGAVAAGDVALGAGALELLSEDAQGKRSRLARRPLKGAAAREPLGQIEVPAGTTRLVAVFRGVDAKGQPLVANGTVTLQAK